MRFDNICRQAYQLCIISAIITFSISNVKSQNLGHLSQDVIPLNQIINLKIDPEVIEYSGTVEIRLEVKVETNIIQLQAQVSDIQDVRLTGENKDHILSYEINDNGLVSISMETMIKPGKYDLEITFISKLSTRASAMYKVDVNGSSYVFTQFEPDYARKAFPCWDEPIFKIPYQMIITVPAGIDALSNTPVKSETIDGKWKRTVFENTEPIPSYLIALAIGEFEYVDIPGMSIPGRVITVKGKSNLAGPAVAITPPTLKALEDYFGMPYPYKKIDLIAVPEYWWGAMENVGLVTYRENYLLYDPSTITGNQRRRLISITAHELAHMWFGNLVTMEWWDDLWLNESFASWMGYKITHQVAPEYKMDIIAVNRSNSAMKTDQRSSTYAIRRNILPSDNIELSFDALAYQKGQSVLTMFEKWLGEEIFQAGVNDYLQKNRWSNATADDFWSSLSAVSKQDVSANMGNFLNQAGLPIVTIEKTGDRKIKISQKRFNPYGAKYDQNNAWSIPIQLKFSDGHAVQYKTILLSDFTMEITLPTDEKIAWVYPDADASGYYRWALPTDMLISMAKVSKKIFDTKERVGFLNNLSALLDAGAIGGDDYLNVLNAFANDQEPQVLSALISCLSKIKEVFITPELEEPFAAYVIETLKPALQLFGMVMKPGEDESITIFRPELLSWLGDEGRDSTVLNYIKPLAEMYYQSPESIDQSIAETVVQLSSIHGDRTLFEAYMHRFSTTESPLLRERYLRAIGSFRDPELMEEALNYVFTGSLRPQELLSIPSSISKYQPNQDLVFDWVMNNFENFSERIPSDRLARLPSYASGCSAKRLRKANVFFSQSEHIVPGTEIYLNKVTALVEERVALRKRELGAIEKFLLHSYSIN